MDNLTHSLLGVALSRAGLNRLTPQAGWVVLFAANAPDLDIIAGLKGSLAYLHYHRGWTHSFAGAPAVALGPLALWALLTRKRRRGPAHWAGAYAASLAGVLSDLLMDWVNVYGIRLWLPFDHSWPRLDLVNIVDIWIWAILLIALAAPWLARLVSTEIGAQPGNGRGAAAVSLLLLAAYIGFRVNLHDEAVRILDSRTHLNLPATRVATFPTAINPWLWTGVAETSAFYRVYSMDLLKEFEPGRARTLYKAPPSPAMDIARTTETVSVFLNFAQFPYWRVGPSPAGDGGTDVRVSDLRFGMPEDERFTVLVRLDAGQVVREQSFDFGPFQPR